jgi:hypothetical protein
MVIMQYSSSRWQQFIHRNPPNRRVLTVTLQIGERARPYGVLEGRVRGVNYFCRLATTISAGEGLANEAAGDRSGTRG